MEKDFSSVSPSAQALLFMKAETGIPFAKEACAMVPVETTFNLPTEKTFSYWARILHFEERYFSIDAMMKGLSIKNVLELSSGFSFRGLDRAGREKDTYYIDTDLAGVVEMKKPIIDKLQTGKNIQPGHYELRPLNVLDAVAFEKIIDEFPPGPILIVNEGLLMYLDRKEKERLCAIIHDQLMIRGGYWITADIYFKRETEREVESGNDRFLDFLKKHRTQENMFLNSTEARVFFESMGFEVDAVNDPEFRTLSSFPAFIESMSVEQRANLGQSPSIRETWRLRLEIKPKGKKRALNYIR